ncbi:MAG: response regulator [Candidatus Dadabacteria bacterium]|nr:response regulator [Candidatus Dadabacteria bacterium]NIQ13758.1 response regulator [Candidatus Dadabacteria bacterium]
MNTARGHILVVDDEPGMREFLEIMLEKEDYKVTTACDGNEAISKLNNNKYDLAIVDIQMPGLNGIGVLKEVVENYEDTAVIMITAFASHETAIEAMKLGAYDYITKPFKIDEIKIIIEKAIERKGLEDENKRLKQELDNKYGFSNIIGRSNAIKSVFELINRISKLKVNVLITGESGTGKELVARAIHYNSTRLDGPFVPVNCGAIPENLLESELFGYVKGAFTGANHDKKGLFEEANGGTLLLDEIGDMHMHLQVKLLRAIETREIRQLGNNESVPIDVRIIAATNKVLEKEVSEGAFREDLFYRLNVINIAIPALRQRKEDIAPLAVHFLKKYSKDMDKKISGISSEALEVLEKYHFPGNVRELENIIARCVALEPSDVIQKESLPSLVMNNEIIELENTISSGNDLDSILGDLEKQMIENALKASKGNKTEAAKLLGITLRSLRYRLSKHGFYDEDDIEDTKAL